MIAMRSRRGVVVCGREKGGEECRRKREDEGVVYNK